MTKDQEPSLKPPRLLSVEEVAQMLNIGIRTVYTWTKAGKLPSPVATSGRTTRWLEKDISEWAESHGWFTKPLAAPAASTTCQSIPPPVEPAAKLQARLIKELRGDLAKTKAQLDDQEILRELLRETIDRVAPVEVPPELRDTGGGSPVTAVLLLGDWHIGEKVTADEVEGLNTYDYDTAVSRALDVLRTFSKWAEVQRSAYTIDECVVLGLGDAITGQIHEELKIYAEFPPPVQAVKAGYLQAELLRGLAQEFPGVRSYWLSSDNHGRLTKKPFYKGRGQWSLGYVANAITEVACEELSNVGVHSIEAIREIVDIQGKKFLMEHGNDHKAWMGIPFYGIERSKGREAAIRMNTPNLRFDYMVMGHWHVPAFINNILINGSLIGTTAYDHAAGRHAAPCQCAMLVHPRHGIFNWLPIQPE